MPCFRGIIYDNALYLFTAHSSSSNDVRPPPPTDPQQNQWYVNNNSSSSLDAFNPSSTMAAPLGEYPPSNDFFDNTSRQYMDSSEHGSTTSSLPPSSTLYNPLQKSSSSQSFPVSSSKTLYEAVIIDLVKFGIRVTKSTVYGQTM